MPFIFQFGNEILGGDWGSPEPKSFIENHGYPEGTTWEEVDRPTFIEKMKINEQRKQFGPLPDSVHEQIKKLREHHEATISVLEDHLKLQRGDLKAMIKAKLKEK